MTLDRRTYRGRAFRGMTILTLLLAPALRAHGDDATFTQRRNLEVRMSDGVMLAANVYLPKTGKKFPTVLMRTTYNKDGIGWIAEPLVNAGYAVVVQDVRGQFASKGTFIPFIFEKKDGVDTLDWIAKQRWRGGNMGIWGPSYLGYCTLIVAPEGHPNLKTIVNVSGWGDTTSMTAPGGALHLMVSLR